MSENKKSRTANLKQLQFVASKLGDLCDEVIFLGGCTTAVLITDDAAPDVRYTLDVDCIVDVISLNQYYTFEKKLVKKGFKKSEQDTILCRWHFDEIILDVMPTEEKVLGFSNRWYKSAIQYAQKHMLTDNVSIKVVTAPYFIATKLEAFKNRGQMDFMASHDFEDIISVIDGRLELIDEIKNSDNIVKNYLASTFNTLHVKRDFHDALPGHFVQYGMLANDRIKMLNDKIKLIIHCASELKK